MVAYAMLDENDRVRFEFAKRSHFWFEFAKRSRSVWIRKKNPKTIAFASGFALDLHLDSQNDRNFKQRRETTTRNQINSNQNFNLIQSNFNIFIFFVFFQIFLSISPPL